MEFLPAARDVGYMGDLLKLWEALDDDGTGFIELEELDPEVMANIIPATIRRLRIPPNFRRLVLGCIEATFCKQILVGKLSPRSTQCT